MVDHFKFARPSGARDALRPNALQLPERLERDVFWAKGRTVEKPNGF